MQLKTCLVYKFVFLLFNIRYSSLEQTNKLDCADENCTVPIGLGKAEVTISRNMEGFLSMKAGQEAQILGVFGKELFLIETDEEDKRRGFVSQKLFRELKLKKKGLIKSNVTALQRPRLKQLKAKETVEEEKQPEVVPQKNESEVSEIKQTVQERTPAGQVVLPKEEASKLEMHEKNVTEETEEEDEDEENSATEEEDDEDTEEESNEPSIFSKVVNYVVGGGDPEEEDNEEPPQASDKNETEVVTDQNVPEKSEKSEDLSRNHTNVDQMPEKLSPELQATRENDKISEKIVETTTPVPDLNEINPPPLEEMILTTPTPLPKQEPETPKQEEAVSDLKTPETNDTVSENNATEKDLGSPDFKPIPESMNATEDEISSQNFIQEPPKPAETFAKMPEMANIITTAPPLLGLMKRKILNAEEQNVSSEDDTKAHLKFEEEKQEMEKVPEEVKTDKNPVPAVTEVKSDEKINEVVVDQPMSDEKVTVSDAVSESGPEKVEKVTEKEVFGDDTSEMQKVMEKLGAAPDEPELKKEEKEKETEKSVEKSAEKENTNEGTEEKDMKPQIKEEKEKESEIKPEKNNTKPKIKEEKAEPTPIETPQKPLFSSEIDNSNEIKPVEEKVDEGEPETVTEAPKKLEPVPTQPPFTLDIDTYGKPPPPMKPLEENISKDQPIKIDNKLDMQSDSKEKDPVEVPPVASPQQPTPPETIETKTDEDLINNKDKNFQQKRDAIKSLLESDVPKHGSEVGSSEQKAEIPSKVKQGVPSIVEVSRNGKVITPKEVPVETNKDQNSQSDEFCEAQGGSCPADSGTISHLANMFGLDILLENDILQKFTTKTLEMFDLIIYLCITASAVIFFLVTHSCVKRCMRESPLLQKINHLERVLMTSVKENATLKNDLAEAKGKLTNIENSSFGSNEMVIALRKDLDDSEHIRYQLQQQVNILEQELQKSTEAGNELNKMLSDLLNSQTGSESILQSVEQLQKQLDEQQLTIESMTEALASKSRENSELQMQLSEISSKLGLEIKSLKARNDDVELEKVCIENELKNLKKTFDEKIDTIERTKLEEIERIKQKLARKEKEALELHQKYRTSEAKIQALNECINESKKGVDATDYLDSIDAKAELILVTKERDTLKEQLNAEINAKSSMESYVKGVGEEIENLKKEFSVAEKEKLEAQTRLDVLSSYFRQKESELQRELSIKEALWMQQQGETTTTVERVKTMQEEIQQLKSQNDSLKAEILAQDTAYKAQTVALENKAHDAWLNARQSERKVEELRQEATILRRRLTSIAEFQPGSANNSINNASTNIIDGGGSSGMPSLNSVPSPLRVESPNSPIMLPGMPPPPPFLPGGQYGPIPTGLPPGVVPPLPFIPPPLGHPGIDLSSRPLHGRLISPPPPPPPNHHHHRAYSPSLIDDDRYSPDSRYHDDYSVMSTRYDTETDFSPPPSPPKHSRNTSSGYNRQNGGNKAYSPTSPQMNGRHNNNNNRNKSNKGGFNSSGSQDSIVGSGSRKGHGKI